MENVQAFGQIHFFDCIAGEGDGEPADFLFGIFLDGRAKGACDHLGTEADSQKGLAQLHHVAAKFFFANKMRVLCFVQNAHGPTHQDGEVHVVFMRNGVAGVKAHDMNVVPLGLQVGENRSRTFVFNMLKNIGFHNRKYKKDPRFLAG